MRLSKEYFDSVYFYLILFSIFIFGSTVLIYFGDYTEPPHTLVYLFSSIILSPIMEELTFRIFPLALAPLLLVSFQDSVQNKLKNIIIIILFLLISFGIMFNFLEKNYISGVNILLFFLIGGSILFAVELLYSIFLVPRLHEKGYLIIIFFSSFLWAILHFSYGILYPILVFVMGTMLAYYLFNRLKVLDWRNLESKEITRNVIFFSIVIMVLHSINNISTNLNVGNDPVINNIYQNILLLIVFYIIFKLTIKPNKKLTEID